ncbi:MAG TPA: hypothetical protein VNI77_09130 [Nitrososphaera sp.]|nr:hypothetical protein [Nitrososphaera sp.]
MISDDQSEKGLCDVVQYRWRSIFYGLQAVRLLYPSDPWFVTEIVAATILYHEIAKENLMERRNEAVVLVPNLEVSNQMLPPATSILGR